MLEVSHRHLLNTSRSFQKDRVLAKSVAYRAVIQAKRRMAQENTMPVKDNTNAYETESSSHLLETRRTQLKKQHWNRAKSQLLADNENILLSDAHWAVLKFLRRNYVSAGLPHHARYLSDTLDKNFSAEGGKKYLRNLFPGGVITQGCRMANLASPADAKDASFGCSY